MYNDCYLWRQDQYENKLKELVWSFYDTPFLLLFKSKAHFVVSLSSNAVHCSLLSQIARLFTYYHINFFTINFMFCFIFVCFF